MDFSASPPGNLIVAWNNIYLDTVRHIGGAPGPLARIGALMHLAMYEATNLLTDSSPYPSILQNAAVPVPPGATMQASAAYAASFTLQAAVETYVASTLAAQGNVSNPFDPFQLRPGAMAHLAVLKGKTSEEAGGKQATTSADNASKALGQAVATAVLQAFSDASGLEPTPQVAFKQEKGEWRDTGSGPALTPRWGKVPLYLVSKPTTAYLPQELKALNTYTDLLQSAVYAAQVAETKLLGAAHAPSRTAEQTEIAFFWANDLNGTSKPPGQLYTIVQAVAKQQGTLADQGDGKGENSGQLQTARLFALVGTVLVNASIVAWQAKYYWPTVEAPLRLWRPETAIQLAAQDGNPSTVADPAWQPLSAMTSGARFSPNFPAFVSGHSTFGAAFAAAMQAFYGTDTIPFTATTEDPHAVKDENGIRRTRSFSSFTQAALENGRSRIYLGVHYQFDANGGFEIGTQVGRDTAQAFARQPEVASAAAEMQPIKGNISSIEKAAWAVTPALTPARITSVYLTSTGGAIQLELKVGTDYIWDFVLPSFPVSVHESQGKPPHADAYRTAVVGAPTDLVGKPCTWSLRLTNEGAAGGYKVAMRLLQDGQELYTYATEGEIDPASGNLDVFLGETLLYRS